MVSLGVMMMSATFAKASELLPGTGSRLQRRLVDMVIGTSCFVLLSGV